MANTNGPPKKLTDGDPRGSRVLVWIVVSFGVLLLLYMLPMALVVGEQILFGTLYVEDFLHRTGLHGPLTAIYGPLLPLLRWLLG
jgi:hypothetical protein